MNDNYIKIDDLKDGFLYFIYARNSYFGIWKAKNKSFIISRFKFNFNYLFEEYHWDTGEPFGTVKPFKMLEQSSLSDFNNYIEEEILAYLNTAPKIFLSESMIREYDVNIDLDIYNNHKIKVHNLTQFKM